MATLTVPPMQNHKIRNTYRTVVKVSLRPVSRRAKQRVVVG